MVVSELTTTGGDELVIDKIFPMVILVLVLVFGKMLAAIVVSTAIQIAYSTKYALTCYEEVTKELIDMMKNQGLSSELIIFMVLSSKFDYTKALFTRLVK